MILEEEKHKAEEIVNDFFKKEIIKRSPFSPLLQTPHISFKIQCKNLEAIRNYYYFLKAVKKHSISRLSISNISNIKDPEQEIQNQKNKAFMETPGIYYEAFLLTEKNINDIIQIKDTLANKKNSIYYFNINSNNNNIKHLSAFSNVIFHNSPKWLQDNSFNTVNGRFDKILVKIYKTKNSKARNNDLVNTGNYEAKNNNEYNNNNSNEIIAINKLDDDTEYIGFQLIPVIQLERMKDLEGSICLRIIEDKPENYFCNLVFEEINKLKGINSNKAYIKSSFSNNNYVKSNINSNNNNLSKYDFLSNNSNNLNSNNSNISSNKQARNYNNSQNSKLQSNSSNSNNNTNNDYNYYNLNSENNIDLFYKQVMNKISSFNIEDFKEGESLKSIPLLMFKFNYKTFRRLWRISAIVHSIIQRELDNTGKPIKIKRYEALETNSDELIDIKKSGKSIYQYKIFCKRTDGLSWFKEVSFIDIVQFRNKIIELIPEMKNYPFPSESFLAKIPFIGRFYSDSNDDVLIEKKFILDNFFENLLEKEEVYRLDIFNDFFSTD